MTVHVVMLCIIISLLFVCISALLPLYDVGTYIHWSLLSSVGTLLALLAVPLYDAATCAFPFSASFVERRAWQFSKVPFAGVVFSLFLGEAWYPTAVLFVFCASAVYLAFPVIVRNVSALLYRWELESPFDSGGSR